MSVSEIAQSVKTVTTVATVSTNLATETYTKTAILKLRNKSVLEKDELQRLNLQLRTYLDDVRRLEELNLRLTEEVDRAKINAQPQIVDKTELDRKLEQTRYKLEEISNLSVNYQLEIDEQQRLSEQIAHRIKFYQQEGEVQRQKIINLEAQLAETTTEKEYLVTGAQHALEDLEREKSKHDQSEKDIQNLRITLKDTRARNKNLEFETHTLLDEVEFRKAIFLEESNYLRSRFNGTILNSAELAAFYKNELATAIRQIRQDFIELNEQQLREYKEQKEQELAFALKQAEEDRLIHEQARLRMLKSKENDLQSSEELRAEAAACEAEIAALQAEYNELVRKYEYYQGTYDELKANNALTLEKLAFVIAELRDQNQNYAYEIEYWERVTRTKLESEITAYRSLLNSQLKYMQTTSLSSSELVKSKPKAAKVVVTTVVTEQLVDDDGNVIDIRQRSSSENRRGVSLGRDGQILDSNRSRSVSATRTTVRTIDANNLDENEESEEASSSFSSKNPDEQD